MGAFTLPKAITKAITKVGSKLGVTIFGAPAMVLSRVTSTLDRFGTPVSDIFASNFAADEPQYVAGSSTLRYAANGADSIYADVTTSSTPATYNAKVTPFLGTEGKSINGTYPDPDPSIYAIASGIGGGSNRAIAITYPQNGAPSAGGKLWLLKGGTSLPAKTHYVQYWMKWSGTQGPTAQALKFFKLGVTGGDPQWSTHDASPANSTRGKLTYWQYYDNGFTDTAGANQGTQPLGPYWTDLYDGKWHRVTHAYKCHSAAGVYDGFARMWVDGVKIVDVCLANVGVTPPGGEKPWCSLAHVQAMAVGWTPPGGYTAFHGGDRTNGTDTLFSLTWNLGTGDATDPYTYKWWTN